MAECIAVVEAVKEVAEKLGMRVEMVGVEDLVGIEVTMENLVGVEETGEH